MPQSSQSTLLGIDLYNNPLNNEGYYEIPSVCIPGSGGSTKTNIDS